MPITIESYTSSQVVAGLETESSSLNQSVDILSEGNAVISDTIDSTGRCLLYSLFLDTTCPSYLSQGISKNSSVYQFLPFNDYFQNVVILDQSLEILASLNIVTGSGLPFLSNVVGYATLNTYWPFYTLPHYATINSVSKYADFFGVLILDEYEELTASGTINQVDIIGPALQNLIPASGSTFVDPDTEITFDLIDAAIGVKESSINFWISGQQVVLNGAAVSPSGFGSTFLTKISDNLYEFRFIKDFPFDLYETVTVSGEALDLEVPANSGIFLYQFTTWDLVDLGATISGGPDVLAPYIVNTVPAPGQTEVQPNIDITLEIHDLHTGVDPASVIISIDGNVVVQSGSMVTDYASTVVTPVISGRGYKYVINPHVTLPFFHTTVVEVEAKDQFTQFGNPSLLQDSYFFVTISNQHITISGLQARVDGIFEYLEIGDTLPTEDPTEFRIVYTDLAGSGIDTTNSFVYNNGNLISGVTFTEVISGSDDSYYVDFFLDPYYQGETLLQFVATQVYSGSISGSVAPYRDYLTTLQWGYQVCYNPEEDFPASAEVNYCVSIQDQGYWPLRDSYCSSFMTRPPSSLMLQAQIIGIAEDPGSLLAGQYNSINTFFEYGKEMSLLLEVEDYNGNKLSFPWTFTIQNA